MRRTAYRAGAGKGRRQPARLAVGDKSGNTCSETNLSAAALYGAADGLDNTRQAVGAYVRMGVDKPPAQRHCRGRASGASAAPYRLSAVPFSARPWRLEECGFYLLLQIHHPQFGTLAWLQLYVLGKNLYHHSRICPLSAAVCRRHAVHYHLAGSAGRRQEAFTVFDRKQRGFLSSEATVVGDETRTSAPVRIPRDADSISIAE